MKAGSPLKKINSDIKLFYAASHACHSRAEKGISQKDLALASGMKQPDISRIEEGKKNITVETLARICKSLGIENISFK